MKIVSVSMVRNEADIVEAFVRHHAPLVDTMLVVDHRSLDGTAEILGQLAGEGLSLSIRAGGSAVQRQSQVLTTLMREAVRDLGADWVLPLDADEFLVSTSGGDVREQLAGREALLLARLRTYVPCPDDPAEPNPLMRIRRRRVTEPTPWYAKVLVPAALGGDERYALHQGSHELDEVATGTERPAEVVDGLALAHFPVRTADQFATKVLAGWLAHLARPDRLKGEAFHWKRAFDEVASGRRLSPQRLQALALEYSAADPSHDLDRTLVEDPVAVDYELHFAQPASPSPLSVLAATAEALVEELSRG